MDIAVMEVKEYAQLMWDYFDAQLAAEIAQPYTRMQKVAQEDEKQMRFKARTVTAGWLNRIAESEKIKQGELGI